jgi:hypothetical protein
MSFFSRTTIACMAIAVAINTWTMDLRPARFSLGAIVRLHALRQCTHFGRELMTAFRAQAPLQLCQADLSTSSN